MNFIKQDLYQRAESKINKPCENEYNSFLIQVFSKSKCKVIDSCIIPITDKTSFDYDFNEKCHEFFLKSFKNLSGFKYLRNCDYSFKMVDFEIDDHDDDDDDFDLFNDSDNSKNKEKYYFKDFYQIKNEDIDVISVKERTLCLLHLSGYDLTITFTRIKDSSRFEEAVEKQKIAKKQLVSDFFKHLSNTFNMTEKEIKYIIHHKLKIEKDFIQTPFKVNQIESTCDIYSKMR